MTAIRQYIEADQWQVAKGEGLGFPVALRYRVPVPAAEDAAGFDHSLRVTWPYADPGQGTMPAAEAIQEMNDLERRLHEVWETDATAILVAIVTFDGAREWVFYTGDPAQCRQRLEDALRGERRRPVEVMEKRDPGWRYLREELLGGLEPAVPAAS